MYFLVSMTPYTIGSRSPAAEATSTRREWNGRPDSARRATGFVVWGATPCANSGRARSAASDPSVKRKSVRRVTTAAPIASWRAGRARRVAEDEFVAVALALLLGGLLANG